MVHINSAWRLDSQFLKSSTVRKIVESYRKSVEGLWLKLIGARQLTGQQIIDGLKPTDIKDTPTPKNATQAPASLIAGRNEVQVSSPTASRRRTGDFKSFLMLIT